MDGGQIISGLMLMLARLGGMLVFVPIPGAKSAPGITKVLLAVSLSIALLPSTHHFRTQPANVGQLAIWLIAELAFGLMVGLIVGFLAESVIFGLQSVAVQAGFSYSSTIDPNSDADSGVLQALAQITSNLLFFQYGGDGIVLRAFSHSLMRWAPGSSSPQWSTAEAIAGFTNAMFDLGLRLALPVAALLLLTDICLSLTARIQSQLQLLSLAFPVKMLGSLAFLAMLLPVVQVLYRSGMQQAIIHLGQIIK
jgi:flagellar biosynthetic protein FliR